MSTTLNEDAKASDPPYAPQYLGTMSPGPTLDPEAQQMLDAVCLGAMREDKLGSSAAHLCEILDLVSQLWDVPQALWVRMSTRGDLLCVDPGVVPVGAFALSAALRCWEMAAELFDNPFSGEMMATKFGCGAQLLASHAAALVAIQLGKETCQAWQAGAQRRIAERHRVLDAALLVGEAGKRAGELLPNLVQHAALLRWAMGMKRDRLTERAAPAPSVPVAESTDAGQPSQQD